LDEELDVLVNLRF